MNKTTIKISVLAFLGFMTYGYAQQQQQDPYRGKVGINTVTPSATMDVQPNSDNARVEAKTNEGIIAPKLSKTRIANIEAPVEGTLVYATDANYASVGNTAVDTRVAKITEKGYYFYNGTEWVKAGSDSAEQIWSEGTNVDGSKYYFLKPYNDNGIKYSFNERTADNESLVFRRFTSEKLLKNTGSHFWGFNDTNYFIGKDHIDNANNINNQVRYQAQFRGLYTDNEATRAITSLIGGTNVAFIGDPRNQTISTGTPLTSIDVTDATGFVSRVDSYTSGKVGNLKGFQAQANNIGGATVANIRGIESLSRNRKNGTTTNIWGIQSSTNLEENSTTNYAYGGAYTVSVQKAVVNNGIQGLRADVNLNDGTVSHLTNYSSGFRNILNLKNASSIGKYQGVNVTLGTLESNSSIQEYAGYSLGVNSSISGEITHMYGIKLDNINKATTINRAIHTEAGQIRFGDLANTNNANNIAGNEDKPVFVTADGVLKVGALPAAITTEEKSKWINDTANNIVKLRNLSDGTTPRTDDKNIFIKDNGYIGIGTETPEVELSVVGGGSFTKGINSGAAVSANWLMLHNYGKGLLTNNIRWRNGAYRFVSGTSADTKEGGWLFHNNFNKDTPFLLSVASNEPVQEDDVANLMTILTVNRSGNLGINKFDATEKLDVAGNIKSSSLASNAGNRHVYADANGVLKIGTTDVTTLASLWTEDVTNNSIKLAVNSDGSTRSNTVS
ncbi:MAG: hypothetical protein SPI78_06390, partial [Bergeyella zoohelcum]|nr:hypothetical protein [Bergeyella zoohelcum]